MQSNSKLDPAQKQGLADMKRYHVGVRLINNGKTTIAFLEKGNTVEFALAVMSVDEKKFRRKVGEYHALLRYTTGQTVKMDRLDFVDMLEQVFYIAQDVHQMPY